jgi:lysophospholipase L1-like esterase
LARSAVAGSGGLLVAEGDSWFDYPFFDVLEELEEGFAYEIESVAHKGDTLEEMIYDANQLDKLARKLQKLREQERAPRAILLSAGGNDIAGEEFSMLLNHRRSGLSAVNEQVVDGVMSSRLRQALISLLGAITHLCERTFGAKMPIVFHGYDYPVPDGRGYLGGFWMLPGPWLEPGFRRKGFTDLRERCDVMETLIDRYNVVLASVAGGPGLEHVRHVDLRGTLSNELLGTAYKKTWGDELHPTERGFRSVAGRFDQVLRTL